MKRIEKLMAALLVVAFCLSTLAALAESGTVWATGNVNMRRGPGLDYSSIRTISTGTRMEYEDVDWDERGVKWYMINYKGRYGWVSSKYASTSKPSGGSGSSSDGKVRTTATVNMRKGAGTDYSVIRTVPEGVSLSYDKTAKDDRGVTWYRVTYKQRTGWICASYTSRGGGSSGGSGSSSDNRVRTTGDVRLRSGAGLDYRELDIIHKGTTLTYDETRKDDRGVTWYHVTYDGQRGWVSSRYAKR